MLPWERRRRGTRARRARPRTRGRPRQALANDTARVVAVSIASSSSKKKSKKADVFGVPVGDFVAEVLVAFVISAAVAVGLVWYRRASQLAGRGYVRIPWVEKEVPYSSKSAS